MLNDKAGKDAGGVAEAGVDGETPSDETAGLSQVPVNTDSDGDVLINDESHESAHQGDNLPSSSASAPALPSTLANVSAAFLTPQILNYLHAVSPASAWQNLLAEFLRFEQASPPNGVRSYRIFSYLPANTC